MRGVRLAVCLAAIGCGGGLAQPAAAATICVGAGSGCFSTLQSAVDAARNGDTIRVGRGRFAGGITIGVSVTIVGAGARATLISGGGPVLTIGEFGAPSEPTVAIKGVTVTGGVNTSVPLPYLAFGGGIYVPSAANDGPRATVTIEDSVVTANRATPTGVFPSPSGVLCGGGTFCPYAQGEGGGIYNTGAMTLTNVVVSDNEAGAGLASDADAGGISVLPHASLTLRNAVVRDNVARAPAPNGRFAEGAGIFARHDSALTITDSVVSDNRAELVVAQDVLSDDTLAQAGGIRIGPNATASISRTEISGNSASALSLLGDAIAFSGGLHADGALVLRDSVVKGNRVVARIPTESTASASADSGAGEINTDATITRTRFTGNVVVATAPAGTAWAFAGAILTAAGDAMTIDRSVVAANSVTSSTMTGSATTQGAGIVNMGVVTLRDTPVLANLGVAVGPSGVAQGGGIWNGIVFADGPPVVSLTLIDSTVALNALLSSPGVTVAGGGIFTAFPVTLARSTVHLNRPDQCIGC
jgi:hypothetical protein